MLKKVITTAVLGASALGIMAANATTPGVYVTGQLGYANTHMASKLNLANDLKNMFPAMEDSGKPSFHDLSVNRISDNGLAGRLALGYQFNQNVAVELGYMQLHSTKINANYVIGYDDNAMSEKAKLNLNQNAIDLAVKGILPVASNFNVYGKLGVAYLTTTATAKSGLVIPDDTNPVTLPALSFDLPDVAKHKLAPEAAIGVSYDITPNVSVDTSWTHIQPVGKNRPGNIDFVAVGLGYHFG